MFILIQVPLHLLHLLCLLLHLSLWLLVPPHLNSNPSVPSVSSQSDAGCKPLTDEGAMCSLTWPPDWWPTCPWWHPGKSWELKGPQQSGTPIPHLLPTSAPSTPLLLVWPSASYWPPHPHPCPLPSAFPSLVTPWIFGLASLVVNRVDNSIHDHLDPTGTVFPVRCTVHNSFQGLPPPEGGLPPSQYVWVSKVAPYLGQPQVVTPLAPLTSAPLPSLILTVALHAAAWPSSPPQAAS